jgi:hypothetical protein
MSNSADDTQFNTSDKAKISLGLCAHAMVLPTTGTPPSFDMLYPGDLSLHFRSLTNIWRQHRALGENLDNIMRFRPRGPCSRDRQPQA